MKYKTTLRVLIIGEWDYAGCGYFLSRAVNQTTDNTSVSVRLHPSTLGFPHDVMAPSDDELRALWKQADVVHIHHDSRRLPPRLQAKPTVVTYHGSMYRAAPKVFDDKAHALGWVQTAATLDLVALNKLRWLPDTRPDMTPYVDRSPAFKVCHAPTKRKVKGTAAVIQACRRLADLDLIEGVQWDEALRRKGRCWATVDQFQLGYGCNAVEAWMMGQPVVAGANDDRILRAIENVTGRLPFVRADETVASIGEAIARLKDDPAFYTDMAAWGADYARRYHSMQSVARVAVAYYHEAIEAFYSRGWAYSLPVRTPKLLERRWRGRGRGVRPTPASGRIEVEYVGSSVGWVPFEVNGRKYKFSKLHPIREVDQADVAHFLNMRDLPRRTRGKRKSEPGPLLFRRVR